ncbi:MAG TPA: hypothetical protein VF725_10465 [Ktedonobacterales bacterium]
MSQRTRGHTTGAAARPTSAANHAESSAQPADASESVNDAAPRKGKRAAAPSMPTPASEPERTEGLPLSPDALARALRAVATELERDPALAQRVAQAISETPAAAPASERKRSGSARRKVTHEEPAPSTIGRSFHPTIVTGVDEALGPGVPDPFALRERLGEAGLHEALATLRLGSLRAIIRQHGLDPHGALAAVNDAARLRAHILAKTGAHGA